MADDKSKKTQQDRTRVNVNEEYEVRYWTERFGVSADELRAAVQKVGPSVDKVEEELRSAGA